MEIEILGSTFRPKFSTFAHNWNTDDTDFQPQIFGFFL